VTSDGCSGCAPGALAVLRAPLASSGSGSGQVSLAFDLRNPGDGAGLPGAPALLEPDADGLKIVWIDCGAPLMPGDSCRVRVEIMHPGSVELLAIPAIRVESG